jgi:hypothetical protein
MLSRDLVPMAEECASLAGIGKPLGLAAGRETDARARIGEGAIRDELHETSRSSGIKCAAYT